ncbi:cell division protein [Litoribacter ruber]|uniref:Cell division protein n=2 Tax=Litoribacter ruber TaxID=702568 RepID=A0AAP2CG19_9BACT|nr:MULTISPECIES: cell division protein FtsQ/DivIB [Litoribacter]MBS9523953.1 cell division protein [Litoribacter alkaliphilus]MBT0811452.1 cell division protein [Litoribacter ruber]
MSRLRIKNSVVFTLLVAVLLGFIAFVEKKEDSKVFHKLEVIVASISDVYFVDEKEIVKILENEFSTLKPGTPIHAIDLKSVEKKVGKHPFVKDAEAFKDLKGNVVVKINQHKPIARVVRPMAADGYISSEGIVLPTSQKYTSRVLLIDGPNGEALLGKKDISKTDKELLELIHFIVNDKFWNAQISSMEINQKGDITLYQQVGKQTIEFGKPTEIEEKFKKIEILYKEILPKQGWNAYDRVNVKYKDQIICE